MGKQSASLRNLLSAENWSMEQRNSEGVHIREKSNARSWVVNSRLPTTTRHVSGGVTTLCFNLTFIGSLLP